MLNLHINNVHNKRINFEIFFFFEENTQKYDIDTQIRTQTDTQTLRNDGAFLNIYVSFAY